MNPRALTALVVLGCSNEPQDIQRQSTVEPCVPDDNLDMAAVWDYKSPGAAYTKFISAHGPEGFVFGGTEYGGDKPSWIGHVAADGTIVNGRQVLGGDGSAAVLQGLAAAADGHIAMAKQVATEVFLEELDASAVVVWSRLLGSRDEHYVSAVIGMAVPTSGS